MVEGAGEEKGMSSQNDSAEDIKKLWECLREGRMNQARLLHIHLKKIHKLEQRQIRKQMETLGLEKVVQGTTEKLRNKKAIGQ